MSPTIIISGIILGAIALIVAVELWFHYREKPTRHKYILLGAMGIIAIIVGLIKGEEWAPHALAYLVLGALFWWYALHQFKQLPQRMMDEIVARHNKQ